MQRRPRLKGWPTSVPCFFLPLDEGKGEFVSNHGTMGDPTWRIADPDAQWRLDGRFATQGTAKTLLYTNGQCAWAPNNPENASLRDKLFFFRNCTAASPGIGGNIALVSFRIEASGDALAQSRILTAGMAGIAANVAAWELLSYFTAGNVVFGRKEGFAALATSNTLFEIDGLGYVHVVLLLDALNKDIFAWLNGQPVSIAQSDKDSATNLFYKYTDAAAWDNNGITLTIGNTNLAGQPPGKRLADDTVGKTIYGKPFGDMFFADITALDAVLAARRDDIALAMYESPEGYLSEDVIALMTP